MANDFFLGPAVEFILKTPIFGWDLPKGFGDVIAIKALCKTHTHIFQDPNFYKCVSLRRV